jgi:predicted nucleotide-binding protein (sugar kinase/HSP70/actin superfamily)
MVITFPHLGNVYICVKAMLDDLGVDYVIPPFNNKKALELGTKHVPEMACLPLKINIGNFIQAYEMGADTVLMAGGCGPCRFGYYCEMHREIMRDAGYEMDILTLELSGRGYGELLRKIRTISGAAGPVKLISTIKKAALLAKRVDELEAAAFRKRARETVKGSTDAVYNGFRKSVLDVKGSGALAALVTKTFERLEDLEMDKSSKPLRVGIVGEIYTNIEHFASFELQEKLGYMGVEVDRKVTLSNWIGDHIIKKALHLPVDNSYVKAAKPYLGTMIGGHAQETVGHTVLYAGSGYDGVIQIFPLSCMPEIVAESLLPSIERDLGIPVLTLIMDEMTGEAGYMTRVEAFVDLLNKRREESEVENDSRVLSRN